MTTPHLTAEPLFNASMLQLARAAQGLTQEEAAKASNVTQALLSKLENKILANPSGEVVDALASALRFPTAFFYQDDVVLGLPHFHHRKRTKLQAKPLAKIHAITNIRRLHIARMLRSHPSQPEKPIPQYDLDEIGLTPRQLALRMREYWMLPRGPVANLVDVIEQAGGIVVLSDFGTALLDGISLRAPEMPPLFMNAQVPADRFRFSLAHELAHMIMHNVPDDDEKMERQADEFAASFLMPEQDVKPYVASATLAKLGRAKPYWRVSIKALVRRAHDLKVITNYQYRALSIEYNKARYNEGEPHPIEFESPTALSKLVAFHMQRLGYSEADMAKLLCVDEEHFRRAYLPQKKGLRLVVSN